MTDEAQDLCNLTERRGFVRTTRMLRLSVPIISLLIPPYVLFVGESSQIAMFNAFGLPAGLQDQSVSGDFMAGTVAILNASITAIFVAVLLVCLLGGMASMVFLAIADTVRSIDRKVGHRIRGVGRAGLNKIRGAGCIGPILMISGPFIAMMAFGLLYGIVYASGTVLSVGYEQGLRMAEEAKSNALICTGLKRPAADGGRTDCVSVTTSAGLKVSGYAMPADQQIIIIENSGRANWIKSDDGIVVTKTSVSHPPQPLPKAKPRKVP